VSVPTSDWNTRPKLAAVVEFLEWTEADRLRHSKIVALREDKIRERVVKAHKPTLIDTEFLNRFATRLLAKVILPKLLLSSHGCDPTKAGTIWLVC
jgi:hypothetical protein